MSPSELLTRMQGRVHRLSARMFYRRPLVISSSVPIVSFTFDDFPRSALLTGGRILKHFGAVGTYYASLGLMSKEAPTGTMFVRDDLDALLKDGHELGCHTFGHCDAGTTTPTAFENSVIENQKELAALYPGQRLRTLSYPISQPRARTKQLVAKHFGCCRGGGQTFNTSTADLNCLSAFFLEQSGGDLQAVTNVIEENRQHRGWLIFATHDVDKAHTQWGCTPDFFEAVVRAAVESNSQILPVHQAFQALSSTH